MEVSTIASTTATVDNPMGSGGSAGVGAGEQSFTRNGQQLPLSGAGKDVNGTYLV